MDGFVTLVSPAMTYNCFDAAAIRGDADSMNDSEEVRTRREVGVADGEPGYRKRKGISSDPGAGAPGSGGRCRAGSGAAATQVALGRNISTTDASTLTTTMATPSVNSGVSSANTRPKGSATGLLVEWASCMRSHGDPDQTPPTIDVHYGINITIPTGASEALSAEVHGGTARCNPATWPRPATR